MEKDQGESGEENDPDEASHDDNDDDNEEGNDDNEDDDDDDVDDDDEEGEEDDDENDVGHDFRPSTITPSTPGIPTPSPNDIICGRGKMTSSHQGNRQLRDLVLQKKHEYQRAKRRDDKTSITSEIVQTLRESGRYVCLRVQITSTSCAKTPASSLNFAPSHD